MDRNIYEVFHGYSVEYHMKYSMEFSWKTLFMVIARGQKHENSVLMTAWDSTEFPWNLHGNRGFSFMLHGIHVGQNIRSFPWRLHGIPCKIFHRISMEHDVFHAFWTEYCSVQWTSIKLVSISLTVSTAMCRRPIDLSVHDDVWKRVFHVFKTRATGTSQFLHLSMRTKPNFWSNLR